MMVISNPIETKFTLIEQGLLNPSEPTYYAITSANLSGITIRWVAKPLKNGGSLKRKGVYGYISYCYRGIELTRDEAIKEYCKPPELRQALIEAEAAIECSVCGLVVAGREAIDPYRNERPWGLMFYRMNPDRVHAELITLSVCPDCMDAIYKGRFRRDI